MTYPDLQINKVVSSETRISLDYGFGFHNVHTTELKSSNVATLKEQLSVFKFKMNI